jgi:hypothetical protein
MSWADFYTIGLPDDVRSERLDEVRSDLFEQVAAEDRARSSDRALARSIGGRAIRGAVADVGWRRAELRGQVLPPAARFGRAALALAIAAGVVTSCLLLVDSGAETSNASLAQVQVGYLKDQVHSEALFVVPLSSQFAEEARELATDPIYTQVLKQDRQGVLVEQNNLRVLLSQLANAQRQVEGSSATAIQHSVLAGWLTTLSVIALVPFAIVLWFEPRRRRAAGQTAKS